jgi:hypothetical protein
MVQTRKFSQFGGPDTIQSSDIVVGLRNGMNWQFTGINAGGGGSGGVSFTITQIAHGLIVGNWVRINSAGNYVRGIANTPENSDVIGVVIATPDFDTFTLQQSGYITSSQNVFSGLVPGDPYYLNTDVGSPGTMTNVDALVDGFVSRPVFIPDTANSGWVVPYRGIIIGGGPDTSTGGGGSGTDSNITTVTQTAHGFIVGDVIRQAPANTILMQAVYTLAFADTLPNARAVGVVIEVINPNSFRVQFSGYNQQSGSTGGITVDDLGSPLATGVTYFLSVITPGKVSAIEPFVAGQASKPMYVCEQTVGDTGINAGWILDQRPLLVSGSPPPPIETITETNADTPFRTTDPGWINTGICATITTTTALQRVLIMGALNLASDGSSGVAYRVTRNGTPIDVGDAAGLRTQSGGVAMGEPFSVDSGIAISELYYDSPGAAGIYTYCFEVNKGASAGVTINRASVNVDPDSPNFFRTASSILLWIV